MTMTTTTTTLIIDNYDSFTWNLYQLFGALGAEPRVVRNDAMTIDDVHRMAPARIVLSPGPGRPDDPARIGVCRQILEQARVPILGVCLGHQAIACMAGGRVIAAPRLMHGKTSSIKHDGAAILRDLPRPFEAMRYHSLTIDPKTLPDSLVATAWCDDDADDADDVSASKEFKPTTIMAVRHRERPIFGVQFHPESIGTKVGSMLCRTFLEATL
jgi:anthranilate synthase component 2